MLPNERLGEGDNIPFKHKSRPRIDKISGPEGFTVAGLIAIAEHFNLSGRVVITRALIDEYRESSRADVNEGHKD